MSGDVCTCGGTFRTGEDFRDHMPCPGTKEFQITEKWRKRCELAEKALDILVEDFAHNEVNFSVDADTIECALVAWEEARGARFVYFDGCEYIIASGRGGLSKWLVEQGCEADQRDWELLRPDEVITIWCDEDGDIVEEEGIPTEKTVAEWLEKVKHNGLLCREE
jgi:hypothetical protein